MWLSASWYSACLWTLLTPIVFVGSIYIGKPPRYHSLRAVRDHPNEILRRIAVISGVCLVWPCCLYVFLSDPEKAESGPSFLGWLGLALNLKAYFSLASCLFIIVSLFFGPLLTFAYSTEDDFSRFDLRSVRGYIAAPIFEELIFRSCLITVLISAGWGVSAVWIAAVVFGASHFHLLLEVPRGERRKHIPGQLFQCIFTGVFGAIVGMMFWYTGCLYGPVAVHSFCNFMSFPDLSFLSSDHSAYKYRRRLVAAYISGIITFLVLWWYLLDPVLYDSWHHSLSG